MKFVIPSTCRESVSGWLFSILDVCLPFLLKFGLPVVRRDYRIQSEFHSLSFIYWVFHGLSMKIMETMNFIYWFLIYEFHLLIMKFTYQNHRENHRDLWKTKENSGQWHSKNTKNPMASRANITSPWLPVWGPVSSPSKLSPWLWPR